MPRLYQKCNESYVLFYELPSHDLSLRKITKGAYMIWSNFIRMISSILEYFCRTWVFGQSRHLINLQHVAPIQIINYHLKMLGLSIFLNDYIYPEKLLSLRISSKAYLLINVKQCTALTSSISQNHVMFNDYNYCNMPEKWKKFWLIKYFSCFIKCW